MLPIDAMDASLAAEPVPRLSARSGSSSDRRRRRPPPLLACAMATKRRAMKQLTRDDLDREDSPEQEEPEVTGSGVASADVLAKRKIITARRALSTSSSSGVSKSPFASIQLTSDAGSSSGIGASSLFPSLLPSASAVASSSFSSSSCASSMPSSMTLGSAKKYEPLHPSPLTRSEVPVPNGSADAAEPRERDDKFYEKMRALNESFRRHMTSHMDKDPEAVYSQNCQEYIDYVVKLDKQFPVTKPLLKSEPSIAAAVPSAKPTPTSKLDTSGPAVAAGVTQREKPVVTSSCASSSVFATPATSSSSFFSAAPLTSGLSFGSASVQMTGGAFPSQFGAAAPPFAAAAPVVTNSAPVKTERAGQCDDEEYIPPKNEDVKSEEENAVFSHRFVEVADPSILSTNF